MISEIGGLRNELDQADSLLIDVLGRRFAICRRIAEVKRAESVPMMQQQRIAFVKERAKTLARAYELSPEFIEHLYDLIIGEACRLEQQIIQPENLVPAESGPHSNGY